MAGLHSPTHSAPSLNVSQGLRTCCALCLGHLSPARFSPLLLSSVCSNVTFSSKPFLICLYYVAICSHTTHFPFVCSFSLFLSFVCSLLLSHLLTYYLVCLFIRFIVFHLSPPLLLSALKGRTCVCPVHSHVPWPGTHRNCSVDNHQTKSFLLCVQFKPGTQEQKEHGPREERICAFWKHDGSNGGHWATSGCRILGNGNDSTTCQCNHLSSFAILVAHYNVEVSSRGATCKNLLVEWLG